MNMDIIKNPIIVGIIFGVITFMIIKWHNEKENKRRVRKNKKPKNEKINILIPLAVAIVTGLFVWWYFKPINVNTTHAPIIPQPIQEHINKPISESKTIYTLSDKQNQFQVKQQSPPGSVTYHVIGKGVNFPENIPDVFLDMDEF